MTHPLLKNSPKQYGHRQAMTKTFIRLKTRPDEYTPHCQSCDYGQITHCELCGAALIYSFNLVHAQDPHFTDGLSLKVGADCIYNFCEVYMPSVAAQMLDAIESSLANSKINKFKSENPKIFEIAEEIKVKITSLYSQNSSIFNRLNRVNKFFEYLRELKRERYLSKPKVAYLLELSSFLDSQELKDLLSEHKTHSPVKIKQWVKENPKDKKTYKIFQALGPLAGRVNPVDTVSKLEMMLFRERVNFILKKIKPTRWLEQVENSPETAAYLLNSTPEQYSTLYYQKNTFQRFVPLSSETWLNLKNEIIKNPDQKLHKLTPLWHNIVKGLTRGPYEI